MRKLTLLALLLAAIAPQIARAAFPSTTNCLGVWELNESTNGANAAAAFGSVTLTNSGGINYAAGKLSNAATMVDSHQLSGEVGTAVSKNKMTVAAWLNRSNTGTEIQAVGYETTGQYCDIVPWTDGQIYPQVANVYAQVAYSSTGWHHYVLVYDGTLSGDSNRLKLYIDGSAQTLNNFSGTVPASFTLDPTFSIGRVDGSQYSTGSIDQVAVWDRALSSTEVSDLYNGGSGVAYSAGSVAITPVATSIPAVAADPLAGGIPGGH